MKQKNRNRLSELERMTRLKQEIFFCIYKPGEERPKPKKGCKVAFYLPDNGRGMQSNE